jgi:hypothetical protein
MAPLAWTMTPPRPWIVITGPEFGSPGTALVLGAGAVFTRVRLSTLGVASVATEAPTVGLPAPDSRVMAALPCRAVLGTDAVATPAAVTPTVPGDGQTLVADVTSALDAWVILGTLPTVAGCTTTPAP